MTARVGVLVALLFALPLEARQANTARIEGRVVTTGDMPQPIRGAIVTLTGSGLPGGRTRITDAEGQFVFAGLPPGRFALSGQKPAFLPGEYGATRPGGQGIPLQVTDGEPLTDVTLYLSRGAVITGAVRDPAGEPMPEMTVGAFALPAPDEPQWLKLVQHTSTDDRGVYRLFGLHPGRYVVASLERTGRTRDVASFPSSAIDEMLRELATGRRTFSTAGEPAAPESTHTYAPVFYPGTASPDAATILSLEAGAERTDADFVVTLTRTATIEGTLIDNGIRAKPLIINMAGHALEPTTGNAPTYSQEQTGTGLTFRYTGIVPGRYIITAESSEVGAAYARTEVTVTGDDVTGVTMVMQPTLTLRGRVVFDGQALPPPESPASVRLVAEVTRGAGAGAVSSTRIGNVRIPPGRINPDWTFEIGGLLPDDYRLLASAGRQSGWWPRSAIVNGVDVLDRPLHVAEGDLTGAVITFSDRRTTLSGTVLDQADEPAPAYFMAVFPSDSSLWQPRGRRIHLARTGTDGRWIVEGLPPGDYLVAALSDASLSDLDDADFLATLAMQAVPVTLTEGAPTVQDLQVRRQPGPNHP